MPSLPSRALPFAGALLVLSACGDGATGVDEVVDRVVVTPAEVTVDIGETVLLEATPMNASGEPLSAPVEWSTLAPGVASVSASGEVTGLAEGEAVIVALSEGVTGQATVTVNDPFPPEPASDVRAESVSDTEVDVTWTDNSGNEDEFVVEREEVASGSGVASGEGQAFVEAGRVDADVTSFRDSGLRPATVYRYRVRACNENGCADAAGGSGEDDRTTTFETLTVTTKSLPAGTRDVFYEVALTAAGGDGSFEWDLAAGSTLPPGMSLSVDGVLSGAPTAAGTFDVTVEVESGGQTASTELALVVHGFPAPRITTSELPGGLVGSPYEEALQATEGDDTYTWTLAGGALPAGMELSAEGVLSGTPGEVGTFPITVEVTSAGRSDATELTLVVFDILSVATGTLPTGVEGEAYAARLEATGGDGEYRWSLPTGGLPDGLSLDPETGEIGGTVAAGPAVHAGPDAASSPGSDDGPAAAVGTFRFEVRVESGDGQEATAELVLEVFADLRVTTTSLPAGTIGEEYGAGLDAEGGRDPLGWTVTEGRLPEGLRLTGEIGWISGTPEEAGTFELTVRVESDDGQAATTVLVLTVDPIEVNILDDRLPETAPGAAFRFSLTAEGGDGRTYTWSVVAGELPEGLILSEDGTVSGSASETGAFPFEVRVESGGAEDTAFLYVNVVGTLRGVRLETVGTGFDRPLLVTAPPGDDRLFVVEQGGVIHVLEDGVRLPDPYLDLSDRVSGGGEQGLLGLAFHPDFAANGRLFVSYTDLDGDSRLVSYTQEDPSADVVDESTMTSVLTVPQTGAAHNAGHVAFGPDGMLYLSIGDGGGSGDPLGNAQDTGSLLGSLVRIDVDGGAPFAVPPDNPFVGDPDVRDEIWAYGFRNPWRFSFDAGTGLLFIGDVGEADFEEVNVASASEGGQNYGWNVLEGFACFRDERFCRPENFTPPAMVYTHGQGCSITGGYVYRGGEVTALSGRYVFGDFCEGWIRALRVASGQVVELVRLDVPVPGLITSFGTDAAGELYVTTIQGEVLKFVP